ncbi:MAG: M20/M25/M40 family metallo-hydrolase, partial [Planctomycetota bacterium]
PVCLTAHMDHPGFVTDRMTGKRRVRAFWRGGVPREYFVGSGVRFFTAEHGWVRGRVRSVRTVKRLGQLRVDTASIDVERPVESGTIGMWDFPDPRVRGRRIYARACDDLAGAAAMLCALDELVRRDHACEVYFLFTRAEEVGFIGAMAAARRKTIPPRCLVVAMETSSERVHARIGDGPILRVGDRASVFTPAVTAYCHRVARELAAVDRSFTFQRKLMDGGTCESSAYCALGYDATGLCLALGNYHNVDRTRNRLGPEYIDLLDFHNVVKWFVELARAPHPYRGRDADLDRQLAELRKTYAPLLRASRRKPR